MVGFGEDPGDRPDDTDRSDRGTGRSGTEPSGPPEDDNDDVNPGGRFGGPPEDDNDDDVFTPPSRDGPPEDSGEEGGRVDDVQRSDDPGIESPTDRAAPEDDFAEKPDQRGPTERQEQETVAEQTPGLTEDDIEQVERIEQPDGRDQLRAELEGPSAEAQFEARRERARREADVDAISRLGGFDSEELRFSQRDGRTVVQPTDEAVSERRQELADQRVSGSGGSTVRLVETRRRGAQETGITGALGVDSDAEPQGFAARSGGAAQTIRDETVPEPVDAGITLAAQSFRSGRLGELTEQGAQAFEPAAQRFDAAVQEGAEAAAGTPTALGGEISPTLARGGAEGAQALNPARFAQDVIRSPEITIRGIEGATGDNAPSNIQTAADVTEAGAELAAEEGPEFVRENPGRTAEIAIGAGGALAAGAVAGTGALRGARAAGRTAARARRVDVDVGRGAVRRARRDLDDISVETTTDADAPRLEVDGRSPDEVVTDAASAARRRVAEANEPGATTTSTGTFGRPTPDDSGATSLSQRVSDAVDSRTTLDFTRSRRTFGRPTGADTGNVPVSERVSDAFNRPGTIDLERSRRTFGRPLSTDTDNVAVSDVLRRANEPGDLVTSSQTFGRPLSTDIDTPSLSSDTIEALRRFNDPGELTSSRGTFGRPLAADSGNVDFTDSRDVIDLQRSRRTFGRPLAADTDNVAVSEAFSRVNDPGELTSSRGVFGRPTGADTDNVALSERAVQANEPGELTGSRGVFGRPTAADTGSTGFGDLAEIRGIRISTGRGGRSIDVEDLEAPDPAEGAPVVRNRPIDADADADASASAGGGSRIDSTVDVGGGQVARLRQRSLDSDPADAIEDNARRNVDQIGAGVAGVGGGVGLGNVAEDAVGDIAELTEEAQQSSIESVDTAQTTTPFEAAVPFEAADVAQPTIETVDQQPAVVEDQTQLSEVDQVQSQTAETTTRQATRTQEATRSTEAPTLRRRGGELPEFEQPDDEDLFDDDPLAGVQAIEARLADQGGQNG